MKRATLLSAATPLAVAAAAILAVGDLNPPAGAVAATGKRLTEVEPRTPISATTTPGDADSLFKINQPGSYYLTGNVTGVAGKHGIEIASRGVTLDLGGFEMSGAAGLASLDGIAASGSGLESISILNGTIRGWGGSAVGFGFVGVFGTRVEGVFARNNGNNGFSLSSASVVSNCCASGNVGMGISAGGGSTLDNCTAISNGFYGFSVGSGSSLINCSASSNTYHGFATFSNCVISNCTSSSNGNHGFSLHFNDTISSCTANLNAADGIRAPDGCLIVDNNLVSNGLNAGDGAGIHLTGLDNRVERNNCRSSDRGIDVDSAGNFLSNNTCSGNTTNWDVVSGNICLVVQGTSAGAILGNTGGTAPGSTDPNANFTY
jgi:parallel beta-helix repeat protein